MYLLAILILFLFYFWFYKERSLDNIQIAKYYHINNNGYNAVKTYKKCVNHDCEYLISIAKIYHYGLNNDTEPDVEQAVFYYDYFLNYVDNTYQHDKYDKQYKEVINILKDIRKIKKENREIDINEYYTVLTHEPFVEDPFVEPVVRQNRIQNMAPLEPLDDPQNVHDTYINNTIDNSIIYLKDNTELKYSYVEIKQLIKENTPKEKQRNIQKVLEQIDDCAITKNSNTLKDIVIIVGNNIFNSDDDEYKQSGIANLINQLNDCIEENQVVCFTGIHNRLIYSLNMLNKNIKIIDKTSLNTEILNKCSIIATQLDSNDDLKTEIKKTLIKDYIDSNILQMDQLDNIINEWIDYI